MITYDVSDPGYKNIKSVSEVNNYLGMVGALFSSFVIYLFGLASYFFPLLFFVYGLNLIDRKENPKSDVQSVVFKFIAFLFVLLSTCCLSSMHISVSWVPLDSGAGGDNWPGNLSIVIPRARGDWHYSPFISYLDNFYADFYWLFMGQAHSYNQ